MIRQAIVQAVDQALANFGDVYLLCRRYVPGTDVVVHYIRNSYQNDPFRVILELILVVFAIKYLLSKKYKPDAREVALTEKASICVLNSL